MDGFNIVMVIAIILFARLGIRLVTGYINMKKEDNSNNIEENKETGYKKKQNYSFNTFLSTTFAHYTNYISNTVKNGTVKFFNGAKGFGFITENETNEEFFVHVSGLIDEINEGDAVEFELKEGKKGMNAANVKVI